MNMEIVKLESHNPDDQEYYMIQYSDFDFLNYIPEIFKTEEDAQEYIKSIHEENEDEDENEIY